MPSYKTAFGSYLKTEDLQGRAVRVLIEAVQTETVKSEDGSEQKLVIHFAGKDKGFILNRTNCELLEGILGTDDYDRWRGNTVVIYPTTTKFGSKTVPCLRFRANAAVPAVAPLPPPSPPPPVTDAVDDLDDPIPF